ncbi:hypothetical protein D3C86_1513850 [compost metagenome]
MHPAPHLHFGEELALLVEVVEGLLHVQVRLTETAVVPPAHVAGAHVVHARKSRTPLGPIQKVPGPPHVHLHGRLARNAQVVDRRQVEDLDGLALEGRVEPQPRRPEVPGFEQDAACELRVPGLELGLACEGLVHELGLDEAGCRDPRRAQQDPRQQLGSQKARKAGEEDGGQVARYSFSSLSEAELAQYRRWVGAGPSLKTWPTCAPQWLHMTSVRTMPWLRSTASSMFSPSTGA